MNAQEKAWNLRCLVWSLILHHSLVDDCKMTNKWRMHFNVCKDFSLSTDDHKWTFSNCGRIDHIDEYINGGGVMCWWWMMDKRTVIIEQAISNAHARSSDASPSSPPPDVGSRVIKSKGDEGTRMNLQANSLSWRGQMTRSLPLTCLLWPDRRWRRWQWRYRLT